MRDSKFQETETAKSKLLLQKSQEKKKRANDNGLQICQGCNKMAKHKVENCYVLLKKIESKQMEKEALKANLSKGNGSDKNKSEEFLWYFNSGASSYMCCNREYFEDFTPHQEKLYLAMTPFTQLQELVQ